MDNIYAQKKVVNGKVMIPQMYGDPKGYKHNGKPEWYQYTDNLHDGPPHRDLFLVDGSQGSGAGPGQGRMDRIPRRRQSRLSGEGTAERSGYASAERCNLSAKTRRLAIPGLADYLLDLNPATTDTLVNLTMGGYFSRRTHLDFA